MSNTLYTVKNIATGEKVHGYSLEEAAEIVRIDASEILFAIENEGECDTDEFRVSVSEASSLESHEAMQAPEEYAAFLVSWCGGDREKAKAEFAQAVQNDPTFRLAPKRWVRDVEAAF